MDEQQNGRQMYQGNWSCSECGGAITELPFEPRGTTGLLCRDCHAQGKGKRAGGGDRKMYKGNWKCNTCNGDITELPFEPKETSNLMCRDCFKKSKGFD